MLPVPYVPGPAVGRAVPAPRPQVEAGQAGLQLSPGALTEVHTDSAQVRTWQVWGTREVAVVIVLLTEQQSQQVNHREHQHSFVALSNNKESNKQFQSGLSLTLNTLKIAEHIL